jgi:hypothetical protein
MKANLLGFILNGSLSSSSEDEFDDELDSIASRLCSRAELSFLYVPNMLSSLLP